MIIIVALLLTGLRSNSAAVRGQTGQVDNAVLPTPNVMQRHISSVTTIVTYGFHKCPQQHASELQLNQITPGSKKWQKYLHSLSRPRILDNTTQSKYSNVACYSSRALSTEVAHSGFKILKPLASLDVCNRKCCVVLDFGLH